MDNQTAKYFIVFFLTFCSCNSAENTKNNKNNDSVAVSNNSPIDTFNQTNTDSPIVQPEQPPDKSKSSPKAYSNQRFKDVTVEQIGDHKFRIRGKGQIFEAAFSWVVEDGHNEIKEGHEMTDAGAPAWGNFNFVVDVKKQRPNSTLHLVLFESSAKDGSRQYQLPIPLY